jgi:hypothetical protein
VHQRQVVLHEAGHFICGHAAEPTASLLVKQLQPLLPSLDQGLVHRVLSRDHSQTEDEHEAEYIGSLLGLVIGTWVVPPEARGLVSRLSALEPAARRPTR